MAYTQISRRYRRHKRPFLFALVLLAMGPALPGAAVELEPRRWSHLPIETNFAGAGYAYTSANIFLDPVLKIEDAKMELHSWVAKYIRSFELLGKSARIDFTQGHQKGHWKGLLDGVPTTINRRGLSDSVVRFAINLVGAPPLRGKEYAAYRAQTDTETIVGIALAMRLPTGQYRNDKLINLGTNRFTFRIQLGVVHRRNKWSFEVTGAAWFYTDNNKFFNGNKLEQKPLWSIQGHIIHTFRPGLWAGAGIGYGFGSGATVNGIEKNDRREDVVWSLSFGYALTRRLGIKVAYIGRRTQVPVGLDADTISLSFTTNW